MPNNVYKAIDAALVFAVDDAKSPEGAAADSLISKYDLANVVGRLTGVTLVVASALRPFYELGQRNATQLRPGTVQVSGTASRAHVNGALLRLLLGDGAVSPPGAANYVQPALNIVTTLKDPSSPDNSTKVTIFGAKFACWTYTIPTEDFVMESVAFQALRVAFEET